MTASDDWRAHYDRATASTNSPRQSATAPEPAKPAGFDLPSFTVDKSMRIMATAVGLLGFFLFPEPEKFKEYPKADVVSQIQGRLGAPAIGDFRFIAADAFPDEILPYDLSITVADKTREVTSTVKGNLGLDYALSAVRIMSPKEVTALDVQQEAAPSTGWSKWTPKFITGFVDDASNVRAQADAQAAARNFIIYRFGDSDLSFYQGQTIDRVERTSTGIRVIYVDGWSPSRWSPVYWFFIGLFLLGLASTYSSWD